MLHYLELFVPSCFPADILHIWTRDRYGKGRARVVMEPDFLILMLAGNGRAPKYVFRDCDHVFRPICFKFGGYMGMV